MFGLLQALDSLVLLVEISGVLDLRFHRLQLIAEPRGQSGGLARGADIQCVLFKERRNQNPQSRC